MDSADDMYHLVIKKGLRSLKLSDRPDGSYGTKDIFRPHPDNLPGSDTRSGKAKWKFIGRQGDIIVLVNGENADPTPIENAVLQSPYVQLALAFGAGHERLGLLIIASEKAATMSKEELVKAITPQLEKGNALAADYAKISPDDIIVKPAGTPYPLTAKMTVQRPILHRTFAEEIEAHYAARDTVNKGQELTNQELRDVVRQVVEQEHQKHTDDGAEFDDDTDFFSMGMDSLQSSLVRRRLLRKIPLPEGARLATNVVFEYPTVNLLTSHIQDLRQKKLEGVASSSTRNPAAIAKAMVKKYVDLLTVGTDRATSNGGTREQKDKNHVVVSSPQLLEVNHEKTYLACTADLCSHKPHTGSHRRHGISRCTSAEAPTRPHGCVSRILSYSHTQDQRPQDCKSAYTHCSGQLPPPGRTLAS